MKKHGESITSAKSVFHSMQLLLVQCIVCVIVIAVAFVLKAMGGTAFSTVRDKFYAGMYEHHLLSVSTISAQTESTVHTQVVTDRITQKSTSPQGVAVSGDSVETSAPFVGGVMTSSYGARVDPITGQYDAFHHGVDIAAPSGTPLNALMNGVVAEIGYEENGYGWYVIVQCTEQHQYLYAHCLSLSVQEGQRITAGEEIAYVGSTGRSTGAHLHFEWRENGKAVDPMNIIPKETYA